MPTRRLLAAFAVAALLIALAACRTAPIHNVQNAPVTPTGDQVTMEQVKDAIIRAGSELGWRMRPVEPGLIVGTLNVRDHMAKIEVSYDTDSYDITYKDSNNLNKKGDQIHSNYNGWIQNLDNSIQNNIAML